MELEELNPPGIEFFGDVRFAQDGPYTHDGIVLGSLVGDVLAIGGAVTLIPPGPRGMLQPRAAAYLDRENLPLLDVAVLPIHLAREGRVLFQSASRLGIGSHFLQQG